jgi:thioester reductase-like protein
MSIFLTGSTGYIGSYVAHWLLSEHTDRLALLVRAESIEAAEKRLWKSLQLHMKFPEFQEHLANRIDIHLGDLTHPGILHDEAGREALVRSMDSVIHCAASLNRKSSKACFNVNLRGTLEVVKLAAQAHADHGLRRFSDVSTVAIAGIRHDEIVTEDAALEWSRSDYDPYARTKKFCEHMVHELLPEVPVSIFRPSIVLGDSRFPETTQFDMVRAFAWLARMPLLPFEPEWRADIVPADYVSRAIVHVHQKKSPAHGIYHLSAGRAALTYREIIEGLRSAGHTQRQMFVPRLANAFGNTINALTHTPRRWGVAPSASLMKVFWPYLTFNTVFDNTRIVEEMGEAPTPFTDYALPLLHFANAGNFQYDHLPWPGKAPSRKVA